MLKHFQNTLNVLKSTQNCHMFFVIGICCINSLFFHSLPTVSTDGALHSVFYGFFFARFFWKRNEFCNFAWSLFFQPTLTWNTLIMRRFFRMSRIYSLIRLKSSHPNHHHPLYPHHNYFYYYYYYCVIKIIIIIVIISVIIICN